MLPRVRKLLMMNLERKTLPISSYKLSDKKMFPICLLKFNKNIQATSSGRILLVSNLSGKCCLEAIASQNNGLPLPKKFFQVALFPQILIFN